MVSLKSERRAYLLSVRSTSYPSVASPIGLPKSIDILYELYESKKAIVYLPDIGLLQVEEEDDADIDEGDDPTNAIYIADMRVDKNKEEATILINRGDPTLTSELVPHCWTAWTAQLRCIPVPDHAAKTVFITSCCCC